MTETKWGKTGVENWCDVKCHCFQMESTVPRSTAVTNGSDEILSPGWIRIIRGAAEEKQQLLLPSNKPQHGRTSEVNNCEKLDETRALCQVFL